MKSNIIQFKRKASPSTQAQIDYQEFLFSVFAVTECFAEILPKLVPFETADQSTIDFYHKHLSVIRNFTAQ